MVTTTTTTTTTTPAWLPPRLLLDDEPAPIQRPAPAAAAAAPDAAKGRVEPRVNLTSVQRLRELGGVVLGEETASVWRWTGDSQPLPRALPWERPARGWE